MPYVDEKARHHLYHALEGALGTEDAGTMMQLLPNFDWTDVATQSRVDARFEGVDAQFALIEARFIGIDGRLDNIDGRLDNIDGRLDNIDGRLENIDARFDSMATKDDVATAVDAVRVELRGDMRHFTNVVLEVVGGYAAIMVAVLLALHFT